MPALSSAQLMSTTVSQAIAETTSHIFLRNDTDAFGPGVDVVCAWPVSGQYGPGSRILYYVLIAACVFGRKSEWVQNACIAAALLLPAVAALHGIALAAFHRDGAVDMDIYGAFQLCAIGILAAPVTVRLSRTYFYDPARNAIFLWAGLILSGLLSLTVEFYRANPINCSGIYDGAAIPSTIKDFPLDRQPQCGMNCTDSTGPQSPMRGGAANNKYVIPAPDKLTFGTATLLSAACCVHAILWLASMMDKILEINFKSRFGWGLDNDLGINEPIQGTNGATVGKMNRVNETIRFFMSVAIVPVFAAAGFAILVIGETNFFSTQVRYENEPMASIGQWGPIVGTGLAIVGSLYLLLATGMDTNDRGYPPPAEVCQCKCSHHPSPGSMTRRPASQTSSNAVSESPHEAMVEHSRPPMEERFAGAHGPDSTSASSSLHEMESRDGVPPKRYSLATLKRVMTGQTTIASSTAGTVEGGSRHRVAEFLTSVGHTLGTATQDSFDISKFRDGPALEFPEIPGEKERNRDLNRVKEIYSQRIEPDGTLAVHASRSRASSFIGAGPSGHALDGIRTSRDFSPRPELSRSASPALSASGGIRQRASTLPVGERSSYELHPVATLPSGPNGNRGRQRARRDTLEVPSPVHINPYRHHSPPRQETSPGSPSTPHHSSPLANPSIMASGALSEEPGTITPDAATPPTSPPLLNKHTSS